MKRWRSDFLFPLPGFLSGAARIVDMGCTYSKYNKSDSAEEADAKALASDWAITKHDISTSWEKERGKITLHLIDSRGFKKLDEASPEDGKVHDEVVARLLKELGELNEIASKRLEKLEKLDNLVALRKKNGSRGTNNVIRQYRLLRKTFEEDDCSDTHADPSSRGIRINHYDRPSRGLDKR